MNIVDFPPAAINLRRNNPMADDLAADFDHIVLLCAAAAFGEANRQGAVGVDFSRGPKYARINSVGNH